MKNLMKISGDQSYTKVSQNEDKNEEIVIFSNNSISVSIFFSSLREQLYYAQLIRISNANTRATYRKLL
jgi:hypothetical protein